MTGVLIRRKFGHRHTHSGERHVKPQAQKEHYHVGMEAETGVMLLQTREHLEVPEASGDKEGFSPLRLWWECGPATRLISGL